MFFRFALSRTPAIPIGVIPSPAFVRRRIRTRIRCGSQKLGLGANVPLAMTNGGEAVTALVNGKFVVIRIPYPMGFFSKNVDGRIDNPNAGWKRKGCGQRWAPAPCFTTKEAPAPGRRFTRSRCPRSTRAVTGNHWSSRHLPAGAIQDSISYAVYLALKAKAESVARGTGLSEVDGTRSRR